MLRRHVASRAWKIGGFQIDLHVFRHLAAKVVLDADPSAIQLVSQVLGHASVKTTEAYYADINQVLAQRIYQDALGRAVLRTASVDLAA